MRFAIRLKTGARQPDGEDAETGSDTLGIETVERM